MIEGGLHNPVYTDEGVVHVNEMVYEEITADRRGDHYMHA